MMPSKQHQMAKKIAQLTKVIYTLNTLNENYEIEAGARDERHKEQLDNVTADARSKLKDATVSLDEMKATYEREKDAARDHIVNMHRKHDEMEERLRREHAAEIATLTSHYDGQVETMRLLKEEFQVEMRSLRAYAQNELQRQKEEMEDRHRISLDEMALVHSDEIRSVRKKAEDLVDGISRGKQDEVDAANKEAETCRLTLVLLRQKHEEEVSALKEDAESRARADKDKHDELMRKLDEELSRSFVENERLSTQMREAIARTESELKTARSALCRDRDEIEAMKVESASSAKIESDLRLEVASKNDALSTAKEREMQCVAEISLYREELSATKEREINLRAMVSHKTAAVAELTSQVKKSEVEIARLKADLVSQVAAFEDLNSKNQNLKEESKATSQWYEKAIASLEEQLVHAKNSARYRQIKADTMCRKIQLIIEELREEKLSVGKFVKDFVASVSIAVAEMSKKVVDNSAKGMRDQLLAFTDEIGRLRCFWKEKVESVEKARNTAMHALQEELKLCISRAKSEQQVQKEQILGIIEQSTNEKKKMTEQMNAAKHDFEKQLNARDDQLSKKDKTCSELRSALEEKEREIIRFKQCEQAAKESCNRLLLEQKESLSLHYEDLLKSAIANGMEREASIRTKALRHLKDARAQLEVSVQQLCSVRQEVHDLDSQTKKWATKVVKTLMAYMHNSNEKHEMEVDRLQGIISGHTRTIKTNEILQKEETLKKEQLFSQIQARHADLVAILQSEKSIAEDQWRDKIEKLRADQTTQIQQIKERFQNETKLEKAAADERNRVELERIVSELTHAHEEKMSDADEKAKKALQSLERECDDRLDFIRKEIMSVHEAGIRAEKERATTEMERMLIEHSEGMNQLKGDLLRTHKSEMDRFADEKRRENDMLLRELCATKQDLEATGRKNVGLESLLSEKGKEISALKKRLVDKERNWEDERNSLEELRVKQLHEAIRHENDEIASVRLELETQLDRARRDLRSAQDRLTREGRPEDLEKIRTLEQDLSDASEREKKARDKMLYFQRELLNREENFNQKFTRGNKGDCPMGVLRTKDNLVDKSQPVSGQKNVPKQRRRHHTLQPHLKFG